METIIRVESADYNCGKRRVFRWIPLFGKSIRMIVMRYEFSDN